MYMHMQIYMYVYVYVCIYICINMLNKYVFTIYSIRFCFPIFLEVFVYTVHFMTYTWT